MARSNGIRPAPVYVATFADGTVGRCSFWSAAGKPIDVAAGRRTAALLWGRPEWTHAKARAASFFETYPPAVIVAGHVEHPALAAPIIDTGEASPMPRAKRNANAVKLVSDLWWFIENVTDEDPERTDRFFDLRTRVRELMWSKAA